MQLLAEEGIHKHELDVQKSRRFIGIKVGKSNYSKNELSETKLPVRVIAQTAATRSGWDTVLEGTEFKTTLAGADIQAGVGEKARADAKIILKGIVNRIQSEEKLETNSTVWQKQAGRGSTIETLKLPSFESPTPPKLTAPGGYIVDIPKGNLKTEIEKLAKQPEYAYLKQLQTAKNVDWKQINLAYDKWDYKAEGMTPAAAAVVVIVVTVLTYGAMSGAAAAGTAGATGVGAGAGGAAAGTAAGTGAAAGSAAAGSAAAGSSAAAVGAAAGKAALASLASQAAVALINNKGNLENTLKELGKSSTVKQIATAAVTAGVLQGIGGFNTEVAKAVSEQFGNPVAGKLTANLINTTAAASVGTAVNGGSLKDNLGNAALGALVTTAHGEIASKIKVNLSEDYVAHKIAHAVAGCAAAAAANQGKCRDGAIGAAVGEMVGEAMLGERDVNTLSANERQKIIGYSQIIAGSTVALVKGDVNTAANAAAVAVENNSTAARRAAARWTARQQAEHEYAMLQIQSLTNQIRRIDPQFNGIAMARNPGSPWSNTEVQIYQRYYDNLRAARGLTAQPIYRARIENGNEFNRIMSSKYPYNELYVVNRNSPFGYARVDSYNPTTREIVSRKFTQLSQVQESTAISYIREAASKYKVGTPIANVPSTNSLLRNQTLQGKIILEVPVQVRPIPTRVLQEAATRNVLIRDNQGKVYNGK
ncbi:hemagglutinin [Neisseria sp. N95_16]|uniref:S-layer family protein n=1 Tax=Neisseria brasiliensis TaxID=2666100 RepID=A0A7X2GXC2_9NEIS|nr:S-layer family protein [Neisseria brasiliensis]PJO09031.1 hemagglutinin [Neisseria sp. N95_16]